MTQMTVTIFVDPEWKFRFDTKDMDADGDEVLVSRSDPYETHALAHAAAVKEAARHSAELRDVTPEHEREPGFVRKFPKQP